ncbi:putative galacturonosyltransferase 14 [Hordeum vulgare]|nr:putative galacturonosyltransferase 14 [Hordeum vulgare]
MPVDGYATVVSNVFDKMGARDSLHDATDEFMHLLDDNAVDIDQALIGDYGYNELDGRVHDHGEEKDGVKEIGKAAFDQEQAKNHARSKNYRHLEDQILIKTWKVVT